MQLTKIHPNWKINESGLKIFSFEDLQDAAEKAVQFSKVVKMGTFQSFIA